MTGATIEHAAPPKSARGALLRAFLIHGAALLLYTGLALSRAWPIVLHPTTRLPLDLIDPLYHVWAVATENHDLATWPEGLWSLFAANVDYPTPHALSYGDVTVGLLPLSFPLHALIADPILLANVLLALSFVLSAYGAFALGLLLTGAYLPALVAGLVFAFYPLRGQELGHLHVLSTQWLSAAACCLVLGWRSARPTWWALAGLCLGLTAVTNLYYLAYLTPPLAVVALALGQSWTPARLRGAALATAAGLALVVPFLIPYLMRHAALTASYGSGASTDVLAFAFALPGQLIDSWLLPSEPWAPWQEGSALFPGFAVLALSMLGWRAPRARLWGLFALGCTVLALGPALEVAGHSLPIPLPMALLSAVVPHYGEFRVPSRAAMGLALGLAVLAAWGLRILPSATRRRWPAAALVVLVVVESWAPMPVATVPAIPAGEYWLAGQPRIHVIAELPIANTTPRDWQRQTEIMYDSLVHWKKLVNGAASVDPRGMRERRAVLGTYPAPAARRLLAGLHVDAVVLRLAWLTPTQRAAALAVCRAVYRDASEAICVGPWLPRLHRLS